MSESGTNILVRSVETKPTSNGGTLWLMKDGNERVFKTFKPEVGQPAQALIGKHADIQWTTKQREKDGRTFTDHFLDAIVEHATSVPETYSQRGEDGTADWDIIGLRKTRCLLWAEYLNGQLAGNVYHKAATAEGVEPRDAVLRAGILFVAAAERDIFERPPGDDGIPL